jgi:sec-independent protein translocase protein TatB
VFGLSFGEFVVLVIVAVVVVGPRNLPSLLRNAGLFIGKLRRMAIDLRADSGIDEILREEGLREEYEKFRQLASGTIPLDDEPHAPAPADPNVSADPYASAQNPHATPAADPNALPATAPNGVAAEQKADAEQAPALSDTAEPPARKV